MNVRVTASLLLSSFVCVPALIFAQTTASVTGVITDSSGAIVRDASVVLANSSTGTRFEVKTDSAGSYRLANVPPGPGYTLQFSAPGFATFTIDNVYVDVANSRTQNANLQPAGSTVEVQVSGAAGATIDTTDATVGNNFEVSKLQDLPVQDRSSLAVLFTLQPGITASGSTTGARTDQTNTTVDGLDVNDFTSGNFGGSTNAGSGSTIGNNHNIIGNAPVDSIQESAAPRPASPRIAGRAAAASSNW